MGRIPNERSKYIIFIEGTSVEVTREVYRVYYSGNRAERYQVERDQHHGLLRMNELDGQLVDADTNVEQTVQSSMLLDAIKSTFTVKEYEIIEGLYLRRLSLRELARELGIHVYAVEKRRDRLYPKLRKFLEEYFT